MKFSITKKLLSVVALPILTLLIFSLIHIKNNFEDYRHNEIQLLNLEIMKRANTLIHQLQIERGLSANVLGIYTQAYFKEVLQAQLKITDKNAHLFFKSLKHLNQKTISQTTQKYITDVKKILNQIITIRESVVHKTLSQKESFEYYTFLNKQLIRILNSMKITTSSPKINSDIFALNKITQLQEYAGQERGFVAKMISMQNLELEDFQTFHSILSAQEDEDEQVLFILSDTKSGIEIAKIHKKYKDSYIQKARKQIVQVQTINRLQSKIHNTIGFEGMLHNLAKYKASNDEKYYKIFLENREKFNLLSQRYLSLADEDSSHYKALVKLQTIFNEITQTNTPSIEDIDIDLLWNSIRIKKLNIDSLQWFRVSSERINDIHFIEKTLLDTIRLSLQTHLQDTKDELINQIIITLITIFFLLFGILLFSKKIKSSISQLEDGMDAFFIFLNHQGEKPQSILTHSNDEVNDIAQRINVQIEKTESNLKEDLHFIKEITGIVTLMKDGDFSQRPNYQPNNPHLVDLKAVFYELIELIEVKIKEQTISLEDKVSTQTLELQEQVKELTIARDKAIRAEIAKDEFLANMSHEIRTPLNAILGFVTILNKRITDEKAKKYLNIIDTSGKSLLTIINDILDFSKIQSGKFSIVAHKINPLDSFSTASLLFASKAYEKNIVYAVYIDPNLPQTIMIDDTRVKQILSNLLSNAIKFTPENGFVKVKIVIEESKLIISVQDSGIGISKQNQAKIFSAFEQADGSTTREYGGTGLGLSISAKLAHLMDGNLTLTSDEAKGSKFTLKLPIEIINKNPILYIEKEKIKNYSFAILNNCTECSFQAKLIKKYLLDFGAENILELKSYEEGSYDILFFVPDEMFNKVIFDAKKPAIAMLKSTCMKLEESPHIQALYAPFTPNAIIEAINSSQLT